MASFVDLRSDTVTKPSEGMRRAMYEAEVGDDGSGEDPTTNALEARFAALVGKPAALFVPSGTMGNQIALRLLGRPGTAAIVGRNQHVLVYENGAGAMNSSAQLLPVADRDGSLDVAEVRLAVESADHHQLPVSALFVENTHMPANGAPYPLGALDELVALGLPLHMDGARLFNAQVASGVTAAEYARRAATVMCCLSKGLGAPIGSLLAGDAELIERARGERKRLGGSMRQVGVVAAAGLWALEYNIDRLDDDHHRARRLAEAVFDRWPGCGFDPALVRTNIVVFRHADVPQVLDHLHAEGVLAGTIAPGVMRLVTHLDVDDDGIERARKAIATAPS